MTHSTPQAVEIYESYPRKIAKPQAIKAILRAIERHGYETVRDRTKEFARRAAEAMKFDYEQKFIPYPATFFNRDQFNDDFDAMFPRSKAVNGHKHQRETPIWQRIKATEALLIEAKKKISPLPNKWLCSEAVFQKAVKERQPAIAEYNRLREQLHSLNRELAEQ